MPIIRECSQFFSIIKIISFIQHIVMKGMSI